MVNGGESRRRRRNAMRIGLAAAAVLLVGGVYGATQLSGNDDSDAERRREPSPVSRPRPRSHRTGLTTMHRSRRARTGPSVGFAGPGDIEADFTVDGEGWKGSNYPVAYAGEDFAGLGVYQPASVAGGCGWKRA